MTTPWIQPVDEAAPSRLICLPYAGGGTADFRGWRDGLPRSVDLCPVVLPGRERRLAETPRVDLHELAEELLGAIGPLLRRAPYAIYGHSMGSWLGFELARAARRHHLPLPVHLIVGARRAPHLPARLPPLSRLGDDALVAAVQERYGAIPEPVLRDREILQLFLPALRADLRMLDSYTWREEEPLPVPITAVVGRQDELVDAADVGAWREHTSARFDVRALLGGHFFLRDDAADAADLVAGIVLAALR